MIDRFKIFLGRLVVGSLNRAGLDICWLLKWTTEKPTVAGWYWVRAPQLSARVMHFYHAHGQSWLTCEYHLTSWSIGAGPVEYAGPIPRP